MSRPEHALQGRAGNEQRVSFAFGADSLDLCSVRDGSSHNFSNNNRVASISVVLWNYLGRNVVFVPKK